MAGRSGTFHNAWVRYTSARLESRYRYEPAVYNNFPWPEPGDTQRQKIEEAAQAVPDVRAQFMQPSPLPLSREREREERSEGRGSSLADLYDPLTMPPALVKAHQALDRAVDACYRKAAFASDAQRVEFLFERYQQLTSLLPTEKTVKAGKKKAAQP